ncbi:Serine/threonine-protein kinase pim-1 [Anabarilius grahami]|uniref:non-specific serine/threonine protein kinase n=1 Tax=Anabarilius grahami TaxID=495550 RepID=A0A3N0YH50_ANAGA|nr:Serine/threonine-protein kinase pim-1 [Anabarilius grahami]
MLKRKRSFCAQVCDSYSGTSSSSTDAAKVHQPVSVVEENEMPVRKRRRTDSFEKLPSLHFCDWSGSSDQDTAANERNQISLRYSACALEDHGLQEPLSRGLDVLPPADQQVQTPPAPVHHCFEPVSEGSDSEQSQRSKSSFGELLTLHWSCSSGQGQKVEDQTTAAVSERHAEDEPKRTSFNNGRKRKRSSHSAQVYDSHQSTTSSTDAAEIHQPVSVGEDTEMPVRKRRRTDSFEKLPSRRDWSGSSDQERSAEDQISLRYSACALEDHGLQEPLSSGLEVLPPADQQDQTPPAPVHLSPEPDHNRVDVTTEDDILSRYKIGRKLGEGGFGSVYEGKRLADDLEVAVKIARKPQNMKYISIPGHPAPFPLEVGLLILANRGPKVPEIIELLDWQDQPDQYIMILERPSPCQDLCDFLERHGGTLNEDTSRFIMTQASMAAHMCCSRGVFHRDIKLENLLINTDTLEVKLIDFGCGDFLQESRYERFCGTREYFPPEYFTEGKYHGKPSTVWSLGVLLFLLVCGRFPKHRDLQRIDDDVWFEPGLSNGASYPRCWGLAIERPAKAYYLKANLRGSTREPRRFAVLCWDLAARASYLAASSTWLNAATLMEHISRKARLRPTT